MSDWWDHVDFSRKKPRMEKIPFSSYFTKSSFVYDKSQRVVVKGNYANPKSLKSHINQYLTRDGAGKDGEKAELFTERGRDVCDDYIDNLSPLNGL